MSHDVPALPAAPKLGHYTSSSGERFEVLALAYHSESLEAYAVYRDKQTQALWATPTENFEGILSCATPHPVPELPSEPTEGTYRHYKNLTYKALGIATNPHTKEFFVFYQQLYGQGSHWVRPQKMWSEQVEFEGKTVTRFAPVEH